MADLRIFVRNPVLSGKERADMIKDISKPLTVSYA